MTIRRYRSKYRIYLIGIFMGLIIFYNEFITYELHAFKWSTKKCSDCIKVLLVADPQILGIKNENYLGSSWAIWDSDRYLKNCFSRAIRESQPNVIVFLGDLMDEGHISQDKEFELYKRRFDYIFETSDNIMKIYLPGDNDIGGEEDIVSKNISERFNFAFYQSDILSYSTATFYKVNQLTKSIPLTPKDAITNKNEKNTTNVVLSHIPLLFNLENFVQNVLKTLSPQIIFTAHHHTAMHKSYNSATRKLSETWILPPHDTTMYQLRLDTGFIHELQIPTCSYRMGTLSMGYGLAYIDTQEKTLDFTILWLPNRYYLLAIYLCTLIIITIYLLKF